jgi:hypothetical protein
MIGANTITAPKLTANSVDNTKILDGQVTVTDLAANSLDANKIRDGTVGKAEVSTGFIKKVTIPDQNLGSGSWDPDNSNTAFTISDPDVKDSSVMSITLFPNTLHTECIGYRYTEYGRGLGYLVTIGCNRGSI